MTPNAHARAAYGNPAATRTPRDTEYSAFARVTRCLREAHDTGRDGFPALCQAVLDNSRLWGMLADDLADDRNQLPPVLRAQLLSLAGFVRRHGTAVVGRRASAEALIDINTSIMKGLRGQAEIAA
jgi:flagellar biosynthesis activator protein FlaF